MFKKFTNACVALVQKYLPDPFLFAAILTLVVFAAAMIVTGQSPMAMILHWNKGFWTLLSFSMQMALIVVTGHTLATAPIINKGIKKLASIPKTPFQAILIITFISSIACWINWGFGLIVGAIFAKEIAKQVKNVDYRLLIASAYSGFVVWHGGLSGSIPLALAAGGKDLLTVSKGVIKTAIPTSNTIFTTYNLTIVIVILLTMPILNWFMHPKGKEIVTIDPKLLEESDEEVAVASAVEITPAEKLENSPIVSMLIGAMGLVFVVYYFFKTGGTLDLNIVNFTFLFLSIVLHGNPKRFLKAASDGVKSTAGIVIQFPFYAGIMGMMVGANAHGVSLATAITNLFLSFSTAKTLPVYTFLSAGIVNIFIPSGGGQWAVQGPIMLPAAAQLGVDLGKNAMAIAWGDAWTNLLQPFWALPALAIAGLGARDIMGFCIIDLIYTGVIIVGCFLFL